MTEAKKHPYLPVAKGNLLVTTDSIKNMRNGVDKEDDYFDEIDPSGEAVAKYHVWSHIRINPPKKVNEGWKKFDLQGNELASGSTGASPQDGKTADPSALSSRL